MDKLKLHTPDLTEANITRLGVLFPNCVSETRDGAGRVTKAVDFDLLRQELSASLAEGPQERYRLEWPGKREALLAANAPVAKTLRPCREESVDFDTTQNLFIEGDNLDALKLLQETYLGQVKMIYIDPPYNTGKDFIYSDRFAVNSEEYLLDSGQTDEAGNRLVANTESNGRFHSDWLSMMYPRLKLARNLLRDDGVIFISIDDNEVHNLRKLCDEIFGSEYLLGIFQWKRRQRADSRNQSNVSTDNEYIVAYAKASGASFKGLSIDITKYSNPDSDPRGPWASIDLSGLATASQRPNLHYDITDPITKIVYKPNPSRGWSKSRANIEKMIDEGKILFPRKVDGRPREKKFLNDLDSLITGFSTVLDSKNIGYTTNGTKELSALLGGKYFDFPKPHILIKTFIDQVAKKEDLILDFFAGSATTAHAVMQQNAEDGGKRRFILVQLPEPCDPKTETAKAGYATIAEIAKERIRRAGTKIREELAARQAERHKAGPEFFADGTKTPRDPATLDIGFRVLKVDSSNMADVYYTPETLSQELLAAQADSIKPDRTPEDLLFQVLLDQGTGLTLPITKEKVAGLEVFFAGGDALAACFIGKGKVTDAFCRELAARKVRKAVFRDGGFKDDSARINAEQIFRQLSPHTELRII